MATFGEKLTATVALPSRAPKTTRDMSWLNEYQEVIKDLQTDSQSQGEQIMRVISVASPEEFKTEKNRLKLAGRKLGLVVTLKKRSQGLDPVFFIEEGKAPAKTSYEKLQEEADKLGITVAQLKAQKASAPSDNGNGKRGRPRKNADTPTPELSAV